MKSLLSILIMCSTFVFIACKKEQKNHAVTMAIEAEPSTLDPRFATDAHGMRIANLIFSALVRIGQNLEIEPDAAESWTYRDKVYTFKMRPNLKFSNGEPVTSEDILFSFDEFRAKSSPFHPSLKSIHNVKVAPNEKQQLVVQIELSEFYAPLLNDLSVVKILPKKIVQKFGKDFRQHLVGTGSFRLKNQKSNQIELEAVTDHSWEPPRIETLNFKVIRDSNTRYLKTIKGEIDVSQSMVPFNKVKKVAENKELKVIKYPGLKMSYLILNLRDPNLAHPEVRRALAMGLEREKIIQYKMDGLAIPATSILSPSNPYHDSSLEFPKYNLEEARKIIRDHRLSGKTLTLKTANSPATVERGKVIAHQLEKLGLNVELQSYEWGTYYKDVKSGHFQIALMKWVGATDPDIYRVAFHSEQLPPGRNRGFYINKDLDLLLDEGVLIENVGKRIEHYKKVQKIVMNDLPTIPLWYDTEVAVVHKRIEGYTPPLNGDFSSALKIKKK